MAGMLETAIRNRNEHYKMVFNESLTAYAKAIEEKNYEYATIISNRLEAAYAAECDTVTELQVSMLKNTDS